MSFLDQIIKNWVKYQVIIIILIFLFITLTFYQISVNQNQLNVKELGEELQEDFENEKDSKDSKDSKDTKDEPVYFIKNFPLQSIKKLWSKKMDDDRYISFWERKNESSLGYYPVGQIAFTTDNVPSVNDISIDERPGIQYLVKGGQKPIDFVQIWNNSHLKEEKPISIWRPTAPLDYVAMGDVAVAGHEKPAPDIIHCLPKKIVENSGLIEGNLWKDPMPKETTKDKKEEVSPNNSFSLWEIGKDGFFFGRDSYQKPENLTDKIFKIKEDILEKQENDPADDGKYLEIVLQI